MVSLGTTLSGIGGLSLAAADPYEDQLFDAVSTITPIACWIADSSYLTLDGSDNVSGWSDAWTGTAHDASQATAARRPHWNSTTELVEFDQSNTEWLTADFSTPVASGPLSVFCLLNITGLAASHSYIFDTKTGRMALDLDNGSKYSVYTSVAFRDAGASSTGNHYLAYLIQGGASASSIREDGALSGNITVDERGIGGNTAIGAANNGVGVFLAGNMKVLAIYSGIDATDTAAVETILSEMKDAL